MIVGLGQDPWDLITKRAPLFQLATSLKIVKAVEEQMNETYAGKPQIASSLHHHLLLP